MSVVAPSYPNSVASGLAPDRLDRGQDAAPTSKDYDYIIAELVAIETEHYNRDHLTLINDNAGTLSAGMIAYLKSNGNIDKANAVAAATGHGIGIVEADILTGAAGSVKRAGYLTLTTAQWDAVAGTTGGLTPGTPYYLSDATAGKLTATPPVTATHVSARCLIAISATKALITMDAPRLL